MARRICTFIAGVALFLTNCDGDQASPEAPKAVGSKAATPKIVAKVVEWTPEASLLSQLWPETGSSTGNPDDAIRQPAGYEAQPLNTQPGSAERARWVSPVAQ